MKRYIDIVLRLMAAAALCVTAVLALDITPVGSLRDGLFAPTSLFVADDELAVLEPFSQQLKVYTADGVLNHRVEIGEDASGLTRLSPYQYAYCNRDREVISVVNAVNGDSFDLIWNGPALIDPVDLLVRDSSLLVLDAAAPVIYRSSPGGFYERATELAAPADDTPFYLTSFAYDDTRDRYYVLDQLNSRVLAYSHDGEYLFACGGFGSDPGEITRGGELAIDRYGRVYLTDRFQGLVTIFSPDGRFLDRIDPFQGAVAVPTGITIDATGVVYIASTMGRGISMYLVPAVPSLDEAVSMSDRYPKPGAIVDAEDVRLAARLQMGTDAGPVSGVEFQICVDTLNPSETLWFASLPDSVVVQGDGSRTAVVEWYPDSAFTADRDYYWRVRIRGDVMSGTWSEFVYFHTRSLPLDYELEQNFPNPFNPGTRIAFTLPTGSEVRLEVFNLLGQLVAVLEDGELEAGRHTVEWTGRNDQGQAVATGVYFYRLSSDRFVQTKKMVLVR